MNANKEDIREALLELLGEEETRKGKKFIFPKNVESSYNLIPGVTFKDVLKIIGPAALLSIIIAVIPPYNSIGFWIIKFIIILIILVFAFVITILRPITSRPNIRTTDYIKWRINFIKKQKVYYLKPKNRRVQNGTEN